MATITNEQLSGFLARHLSRGLVLDQGAKEFFLSTYGEDPDASSLGRLLADREEGEAAVFLTLLMEPSEDVKLDLEAFLAGQGDEEGFDEEAVAERMLETCPVLCLKDVDGGDVDFDAASDEIHEYVSRLRLNSPPPALVASLVRERFRAGLQERVLVRLRHSGLAWSRTRVGFLESLVRHVDPDSPDLAELMDFATSLLGIWPETFDPATALLQRYEELKGLLRRARLQQELLRKTNFETLVQQGLRVVDLQPDRLASELEHLRRVAKAVLGYELEPLDASQLEEADLGHLDTVEDIIQALAGPDPFEGPLLPRGKLFGD